MPLTPIQGYRDLAAHLREEIDCGRYAPGGRLPTEIEMSRAHGMNRHTVRAALQELRRNGYIYRVRGKGTFVARRKISYAISPGTSFTASLRKLGIEGGARLLDAAVLPAHDQARKHLLLPEGGRVAVLEIVRFIESTPACLTTSYLPAERFPGIAGAAQGMRSLYGLLREQYGIQDIHRQWSEIEAAMTASRDQERLQMPEQMPVLLTRSLAIDAAGHPIEFCVSRARSDAYVLRVDFAQSGEDE